MIYKSFKDISLSCLGMGNMRLPVVGDKPGAPIDRERAQKMIDTAIANGINYFDTAYIYHSGESEKFLGEAMKKYPRDSYYLATKYPIFESDDHVAIFEEQLNRLKTDYIDFYLLHSVTDATVDKYINGGSIEYFLEQKRLGKIKYLGFSSHASVESLKKMADACDWDFAQLQLNYFDWKYSTTSDEYKVLEERNIPIIVMEPVRGGRLASLSPTAEKMLKDAHPDRSIASWAFRWIRRLPQVQVILSGMSNDAQLADNIATFSDDSALSDADAALLMEACDTFKNEVSVPCTACRYCCDGCPAKINIPVFLSIYNKYKTDGRGVLRRIATADSEGKPADCIGCGACTGHCPQNISVPDVMRELAELTK